MIEFNSELFAKILRERRTAAGLSFARLAEQVDVSAAALHRYEHGDYPCLYAFLALCVRFDIEKEQIDKFIVKLD